MNGGVIRLSNKVVDLIGENLCLHGVELRSMHSRKKNKCSMISARLDMDSRESVYVWALFEDGNHGVTHSNELFR